MAVGKVIASPRAVEPKHIDIPDKESISLPELPVQKKRVRVCESNNLEHENTSWCKQDTIANWYTADEYRQFKQETRRLSQQIQQREKAMQVRCPQSYGNVVARLYQACSQVAADLEDEVRVGIPSPSTVLSAEDAQVLLQKLSNSHGRLGMECNEDVSSRKKSLRRERRSTVLVRYHHEGVVTDASYSSLSSPSCLFAHYMALVLRTSLVQTSS